MATSITSGQRKTFRRLVEDTLEKAGLDKVAMQGLLAKGGEFQADVLASVKKHALFVVWKIIIGTGDKDADDFRKAIKAKGMNIGSWADDMLGKLIVATEEAELNLVLVTVADLGFKDGATRENIYKRAKEFGLELCPAEVGPRLRLEYTDQPQGEWVLIGMEPIADSDGYLEVFRVEHNAFGLWLYGNDGHSGIFWRGDSRWVFVLPHK